MVLESWYGLLVMEELQPLFRSVAPFLEATREKVSEGLRLILDGNRARKTGMPCRRVGRLRADAGRAGWLLASARPAPRLLLRVGIVLDPRSWSVGF